jgi:glycosyltransferase involved in cell wall biosynthesis
MGEASVNPKVTFIVPCYKLAHLLPDCINSILSQTFSDFEVLIMDDCSPDDTPEVASSFKDPRIKHIRNDPNLGHLRNYNKGISLAQGQYIWLISADDKLRRSYLLEKCVKFMDSHQGAGFVFCAGIGLENSKETDILRYAYHGSRDCIFRNQELFIKLLSSNSVLAASGMVRREVYDKLGVFPLNMPFAGDWYLWLLFALHYDVGYLGEPMVLYRQHVQSMTNILNDNDPRTCTRDDLLVLWQIKRRAEEVGRYDLAARVDYHLVDRSALFLTSQRAGDPRPRLTFEDFEQSVEANAASAVEKRQVRSGVYARVADELFWKHNFSLAADLYRRSLKLNPWSPKVLLQSMLLSIGETGIRVREAQLTFRKKLLSRGRRTDR